MNYYLILTLATIITFLFHVQISSFLVRSESVTEKTTMMNEDLILILRLFNTICFFIIINFFNILLNYSFKFTSYVLC